MHPPSQPVSLCRSRVCESQRPSPEAGQLIQLPKQTDPPQPISMMYLRNGHRYTCNASYTAWTMTLFHRALFEIGLECHS